MKKIKPTDFAYECYMPPCCDVSILSSEGVLCASFSGSSPDVDPDKFNWGDNGSIPGVNPEDFVW